MNSPANDIEMLKKALELEREAMARYARHLADIKDPRVNAMIEGFRRNESSHKGEIEGLIERMGSKIGIGE